MCTSIERLLKRVLQRRMYTESAAGTTKLSQTLNTMDLTMLGFSSMLGSSIFVMTGLLVRDYAGASGFISYVIAGLAAAIVAASFGELSTLLPHAGAVYTYTAFAMGELIAFTIGWMFLLVSIMDVSTCAKICSSTIDAAFGNAITKFEV